MKRLALLLILALPAIAQEKLPPAAGVALMDHKKVANLQLDMLLEQRKVLEVTADWLRAEQKVLSEKISAWDNSRTALQKHLDETFGCSFDMDARACKPKEESTDAVPATPDTQ